ncbi:MAG: efflux RND transporter periplasmic adaptor subunit [Rhodobacterales bacterium]|nr:efflux RND transporter periplasmic adaptor subunit [Rhodobacterales bacterium]
MLDEDHHSASSRDQSEFAMQDAGIKEETEGGRSRRWWIVAVLTIAVIIGAVSLVWFRPWTANAVTVVTETVQPGPVSRILALNGQIAARTSVSVHASVVGTVIALLVDEGSEVKAGYILAHLDHAQQDAIVRQAEAALQEGIVAQTQAASVYNRARELGDNVADAVREDANNRLQSAAQEVDRLRAGVDQATIQLDRYTVRAPIDGTVMERHVDPGQLVDTASPLFVLADLSDLIVETSVDETFATQISPGLRAVLQLVGSAETQEGHVSFVSPRVDTATGGLAIRIDFDAPVQAPAGLTVTANIIVAEGTDEITVPRSAIITAPSGSTVFKAVGRKAVATPVKVIDWPAERLVVTDGLSGGDVVITDAVGLTDGQAIRLSKP